MADYTPSQGDLVWLDFEPTKGHEQSGHRPALVLTPERYNRITELAVVCPITSHVKGYPFEIPIPEKSQVGGVLLTDQIRNVDWKNRSCRFIEKVSENVLRNTLENVMTLFNELS